MSPLPTSIDVLITSHNRCAKTLACLGSLAAQEANADVRVVLVDAASTDGTQERVSTIYPDVVLVPVGADIYWGGGMRIAAEHAREEADYHLWLNDDVTLGDGSLCRLLHLGAADRIVVGVMADDYGNTTYGGLVSRRRLVPLSLRRAPVSASPLPVDTLNGNVVLVGRAVRTALGSVRGGLFPHAFGDIDYGLRARRAGFDVVQAPGIVGTCSENPPPGSSTSPTIRARWKSLVGTKELPPAMWWRACRHHGGVFAPAVFVWPYVKVLRRRAPRSAL